MDFRGDDRGQALQVGAILLFGFLILSLSLYQATIVPDQNRGVEFNAYQEAASDLTELRNDVLRSASKDATTGTNVRTGAEYPARSVFINPPPPIGQLRTTAPRNITIENVTAVDGESQNTELFVQNALAGKNHTTRDVRFTPAYNAFEGQPMVVTGQQAYRYTDESDTADGRFIPMTGQTLLQGDRLNLVFVDGDLSAQRSTTTLTTEPISASDRTVTVTGESGKNITLRLGTPPGITADTWVNRTGERLNASNDRVLDVEADGDQIRITLDGSKTYKLKLAKVEVREENDVSQVNDTTAEYVVTDSPATQTIQRGGRTELTVEVRDEFNNPVSGETVNFTVDRGEFVVDGNKTDTQTVTTNSDGKATVVYSATDGGNPIAAGSDSVSASIGGAGYETATFDIGVTDSGTGGSGFMFSELQILGAQPGGPSGGNTGVIIDLRNSGTQSVNITAITINKTSNNADWLYEDATGNGKWNHEMFINVNDSNPDSKEPNDGYFEADSGENQNHKFGTKADFTNWDVAEIKRGESASLFLYEFREQQGTGGGSTAGKSITMDGQYLKLTIYYETESGEQESITTTLFVF